MATNMRGLTQVSQWFPDMLRFFLPLYTQFIADIRGARVRELEEKRINKEMANIRKKFKGLWYPFTGADTLRLLIDIDGNLDGYQKKKQALQNIIGSNWG